MKELLILVALGLLSCTAAVAAESPEITLSGSERFLTESTVSISSSLRGVIHYTSDGSAPTVNSPVYSAPFTIGKTTQVRAFMTDNEGNPLAVTAIKTFYRYGAKPLVIGQWIKAADVTEITGSRLDDKKEFIGWNDNGCSFAFGPYLIPPGSGRAVEVMVGVDPKLAGGNIHFRLDSVTGEEVGSMKLESTGGFEVFQSRTIPVKNFGGEHWLYFVFEGGIGICSFQQFRLTEGR